VRWLPRQRAVGLLIPAVDFWIFDEKIVVANHFNGYGSDLQHERFDDADLASRYTWPSMSSGRVPRPTRRT
jgi:hypothetical protein